MNLVVKITVFASLVIVVSGHGAMVSPLSRNAIGNASGIRNWIFGYPESAWRQVRQGVFLYFLFVKFLAYLMIFQSFLAHAFHAPLGKLSNTMAKMGPKNEVKPCSTCLQPISRWHCTVGQKL